jgi:hypothetical protein
LEYNHEEHIAKDMRIFDSTSSAGASNQITNDDIELGNIVYLLAANSNSQNIIDQSKSNFVLILGVWRFSSKT